MRRLWLILLLGVLLAAGGIGAFLKYRHSDSFFNGKDLDGWEGRGEYWSVRDGALVGASPEGAKFSTFLCSKKSYKDFELRFQVKLKGKGWTGNSGVNIRSKVADRNKFSIAGPQC